MNSSKWCYYAFNTEFENRVITCTYVRDLSDLRQVLERWRDKGWETLEVYNVGHGFIHVIALEKE